MKITKQGKKRLRRAVISAFLSALSYMMTSLKNVPQYSKTAFKMLSMLFIIYCLWQILIFLLSLVWDKKGSDIKKVLRKFEERFGKIKEKLADIFYPQSKKINLHGEDRRSFIFPNKKSKAEKILKRRKLLPRFSELNENGERVRLIYSLSVLDKIKHGYKFSTSKTPLEISDEIAVDENLGALYENARYSKKPEIDDTAVAELQKKLKV